MAGYEKAVFVQAAPVDDELLADVRRKPIRDCASVEHGRFNILFLARIEKAKGIYEALDAYALLKSSHPSASLTIAGDGWDLGGAKRYADSRMLADVFFLGHVEGSAKFASFRSADAYLFPSYTEGLPISVLEAMAYGLPVVTCAVGGLCDFFEDNRMGFITQSHDPQVLASLYWAGCWMSRPCAAASDFSIEDMPQNTSQLLESPPDFKTCTSSWLDPLIERFCMGTDLSTYDPYDIWKTVLRIPGQAILQSASAGRLGPGCRAYHFRHVCEQSPADLLSPEGVPHRAGHRCSLPAESLREDGERRLIERAGRASGMADGKQLPRIQRPLLGAWISLWRRSDAGL